MPYCHNCNREQDGRFCSECGSQLRPSPPASLLVSEQRGDTGVDRSARQVQKVDVYVAPTAGTAEEAGGLAAASPTASTRRARAQ